NLSSREVNQTFSSPVVSVVVNELETDHQVVSAAKYFVAFRRIARSSSSRSTSDRRDRLSARNESFSTRRRASSSSCASAPSGERAAPLPTSLRAWNRDDLIAPREMSRSAAAWE